MNRRMFLCGLTLGTLATPLAAAAQPVNKVYRVGFLGGSSPTAYAHLVGALRQRLRDLGYVEGKTLYFEYRWAEGKYERLPALATELVRLKPDVIVTQGTPAARVAKDTTRTIPIVMAISGDAVTTGLVNSIAKPGGNVTGSTFFLPELNAKRLELLKQALPRATRFASLAHRDNPAMRPVLQATDQRAKLLGVEHQRVEIQGPDELPGAFATMVKNRIDGVVVIDDGVLIANARQVADLATKHRLPTIGFREYVDAGGLLAYAVDFPAIWRRGADFVDKVLKGAKPSDLPVEQASKFELVINLKTANAFRLTIPQTLLLRANQVIE
jgi:putative ABC transport system substrate-binding protein